MILRSAIVLIASGVFVAEPVLSKAEEIPCNQAMVTFSPKVCQILKESQVSQLEDIRVDVSWNHHRQAAYSCAMNEAISKAQNALKLNEIEGVPSYLTVIDFAERVNALRSLAAEAVTSIFWLKITPLQCLEEEHVIIMSLRRRTEIVEKFKGCEPVRFPVMAGLRDLCDFEGHVVTIRNLPTLGHLALVDPGSIKTVVTRYDSVPGLSEIFKPAGRIYRDRWQDIESVR